MTFTLYKIVSKQFLYYITSFILCKIVMKSAICKYISFKAAIYIVESSILRKSKKIKN